MRPASGGPAANGATDGPAPGADAVGGTAAGGAVGGTTEEVLTAMPSLGRLYSRAVGRTGMLMLARPAARTHRLPAVTYRVEGVRADPERLTDYQHLLGEPGTDALPAGYVHVLAFPLAMALMVRDDFPLPVLGLVHVANRVVQHRAVRLDEELTVRAHAAGLRPHRRGTQVDLVVTVAVAGRTVWEGVSTYLAKGHAVGEPPEAADSDANERRTGGEPVTAGVWRLAPQVARQYAEVSGDRNPIHVSRLGARVFGFPRTIAHGMYTAARALAAVGPARGESFVWEVQFAKPVLLPGTVRLTLARDDGAYRYLGQHARSGKVHFSGTIVPR